jgi:DTW domain-containing protein YfiP
MRTTGRLAFLCSFASCCFALSNGPFSLGASPRKKSLSDLLSSPERYAGALNMTVEEILQKKRAHLAASQELHVKLTSPSSSASACEGADKHRLICEHRIKHGRHPFVCPDCWSYVPVCVCGLADSGGGRGGRGGRRALPARLEVVVWTHHKEWGLTSNTGSLLARTLAPVRLLMKGYPPHDQVMADLVAAAAAAAGGGGGGGGGEGGGAAAGEGARKGDEGGVGESKRDEIGNRGRCRRVVPVVLWPSGGGNGGGGGGHGTAPPAAASTTLEQLQRILAEPASSAGDGSSGGRVGGDEENGEEAPPTVVLIAVDGTWRNARRMVSKLPPAVARLDLPEDCVFLDLDSDSDSDPDHRKRSSSSSSSSSNNNNNNNNNNNQEEEQEGGGMRGSKRGAKPRPRQVSLLAPLRKRRGGEANNVCTAEAVVAALQALGLPKSDAAHVLRVVKAKVDLTKRYRGKVDGRMVDR